MNPFNVYRIENCYFGIFSEDYWKQSPLDDCHISIGNPLPYLWKFQSPELDMPGVMLNFGHLLNENSNHFNKEHSLYIIKDEKSYFALKMEDFEFGIDLSKENCELIDNTLSDLKEINYSLHILAKQIFYFQKKKIYILNPKLIRDAFRHVLSTTEQSDGKSSKAKQ